MAVPELTYGFAFRPSDLARRQYEYAMQQWAQQERSKEKDMGAATVIEADYKELPAPNTDEEPDQ